MRLEATLPNPQGLLHIYSSVPAIIGRTAGSAKKLLSFTFHKLTSIFIAEDRTTKF